MSSVTATTQTTTNKTFSLDESSYPNQDPPKSVPGSINFYNETINGEAPYSYVETSPAGVPRTNVRLQSIQIPIHDMRGLESTFNLDTHAFLPIPASSSSSSNPTQSSITTTPKINFADPISIKTHYYPEIENLLLHFLPGTPSRVFIFDHTVRSNSGSHREPVLRAHIDQTPLSARQRVRHHLPLEAETLLKSRVRLVNVWRPINGPVESTPLAVADSSSVSEDQLLAVEHRYPDRTGETAGVRFREGTRWWFWGGMREEERLLLQCYDSESGSRAPHSAFRLEGEGEEGWRGRARESIEVRALVFG